MLCTDSLFKWWTRGTSEFILLHYTESLHYYAYAQQGCEKAQMRCSEGCSFFHQVNRELDPTLNGEFADDYFMFNSTHEVHPSWNKHLWGPIIAHELCNFKYVVQHHSSHPDLYCLESCKRWSFGNREHGWSSSLGVHEYTSFLSFSLHLHWPSQAPCCLPYTFSLTYQLSASGCQLTFFSICRHRWTIAVDYSVAAVSTS